MNSRPGFCKTKVCNLKTFYCRIKISPSFDNCRFLALRFIRFFLQMFDKFPRQIAEKNAKNIAIAFLGSRLLLQWYVNSSVVFTESTKCVQKHMQVTFTTSNRIVNNCFTMSILTKFAKKITFF